MMIDDLTPLHETLIEIEDNGRRYATWSETVWTSQGVQVLIAETECHWLIDIIITYLATRKPTDYTEIIWTLKPRGNGRATLTARENGIVKFRESIEFGNFPFNRHDPFQLVAHWGQIRKSKKGFAIMLINE